MQSNGGLTDAQRFQGKDAILSGPAGGIVGMVRTAQAAGLRPQVIGFDMGGTSTDVSHYAGEFERAFETQVAGVRMRAPMMSIHTVAAGGGSILHFDGARFRVGPEIGRRQPRPGVLPARRAAGGDRCQRDARQDPAGVSSRRCSARTATSRWTATWCAAKFSDAGRARSSAPPATQRSAGAGRRGLRRHRRRQHGQRDQEDLGAARLRRHALHAAVLRRRRRPARLPRGRRAGHGPRVRPPAGRRAVGLRHGPGRPERDARAGGRAARSATMRCRG